MWFRRRTALQAAQLAFSGSLRVAMGGWEPPQGALCESCRWQELTPGQRRRETLRELLAGGQSYAAMQRRHTSYWTAYRQGWYDRHREDWIQTGDPVHLTRMNRHVTS